MQQLYSINLSTSSGLENRTCAMFVYMWISSLTWACDLFLHSNCWRGSWDVPCWNGNSKEFNHIVGCWLGHVHSKNSPNWKYRLLKLAPCRVLNLWWMEGVERAAITIIIIIWWKYELSVCMSDLINATVQLNWVQVGMWGNLKDNRPALTWTALE